MERMLAIGGAGSPRVRQFVRPEVIGHVLSDRNEDLFELRIGKIFLGVDPCACGSSKATAVPAHGRQPPVSSAPQALFLLAFDDSTSHISQLHLQALRAPA